MMRMELIASSLVFLTGSYLFIYKAFAGSLNDAGRRKKALLLCAAVLLVAGLVKMQYDASSALETNYYSVMEVGRQASVLDIRKSYKALSRRYHPDKYHGADAETLFESVKSAYDILMDEGLRDVYNRFGSGSLEFDPRKDEVKLVSDMAAVYVFWGVVAFVMTANTAARAARTWITVLGIALLVVETMLSLTEASMPAWMLPATLTEHELLFYMHSAFPVAIAMLSALSVSLHVDVNQTSLAVLKNVFVQQKAAQELLAQMETAIDIAKKPTLSAEDIAAVEGVRARVVQLKGAMENMDDDCSRRIEDLRASSSNPGSGYHWIVFVLLYGGIYFLQ